MRQGERLRALSDHLDGQRRFQRAAAEHRSQRRALDPFGGNPGEDVTADLALADVEDAHASAVGDPAGAGRSIRDLTARSLGTSGDQQEGYPPAERRICGAPQRHMPLGRHPSLGTYLLEAVAVVEEHPGEVSRWLHAAMLES